MKFILTLFICVIDHVNVLLLAVLQLELGLLVCGAWGGVELFGLVIVRLDGLPGSKKLLPRKRESGETLVRGTQFLSTTPSSSSFIIQFFNGNFNILPQSC